MDTFKELGTAGAIRKLYEGSGFNVCTHPWFEFSGNGYCITTSCVLLEGIDFDLTFFPFKHLGYKAVLKATGELYSVIATPRVLKVVIGVSSKLDYPEVAQIWEGVVGAARKFGYRDVALELVPSLTGLSISVSASGEDTKENAAARPIAKSMDLICISNNVGASFLGQQILQSSKSLGEKERSARLEKYRQLVGAYLHPEFSEHTLEALSESGVMPSFGYFCAGSLGSTVQTLCAQSGLGAKIYVDKLPFAGGSIDAAKELGLDPVQAAMKGGDDCCLLYTVPIGSHETFRHDFQSWDVIGHLAKPEVGAVLVSPDGLEHQI